VDINPTAMGYADPGLELPFGRLFIDVFSRWADIIPNYVALEGRAELKLERPPFSFFELKIISLKDRQGHVVGKLITWRDITARKQVEEQLRIFFHAVEQNPAAIVITDPNGGIEYVNPHFTRLTGYTLNEMRGKTPRILKSGETSDDTYKTLWQTIKAGQVWEGEVLNRKKNEELYWVNELIAPVLDENGVATHFVAMQQDITERKHTESELRVINTRLQVQLMEIENLHDQLREEAIRDGLTRLFNRRYMEETLDREISRAERGSFPIGVVMMDVDLFKSINDSYGHQAGDAVLQTLGTMLLENTRISDIACRFGGDEMLVVMPGATQDVAVARAEEWRVAFSMMEFTFGEERIRTTLSLGVASFPDQARNPIELLTAADKALYWAKIGRNNVCRYEPGMMARSLNRSDDIR
jgi:diguanylate cyclase (GGDEF)-like protein/PAS domain S-box-containing protein